MSKRVRLISLEDGWEGLYVNGRLMIQKDYITPAELMECLQEAGLLNGIDFQERVLNQEQLETVHSKGGFPEYLEYLIYL